jgi:hypothetical protein
MFHIKIFMKISESSLIVKKSRKSFARHLLSFIFGDALGYPVAVYRRSYRWINSYSGNIFLVYVERYCF